MPLFKCSNCGCVDNTALGRYWMAVFKKPTPEPPLCAECDPGVGKWHDAFPRMQADAEFAGLDGKLYRYVIDTSESLPNLLKEEEVNPSPPQKKQTPAERRRTATKEKKKTRN